MTPRLPIPMGGLYSGPDGSESAIDQIKAQDKAHTDMGHALGNFLVAAFPQAAACARSLEEAYIALMTVGSDKQLERLEAQVESGKAYRARERPNMLVQLVQAREQVEDQIAKATDGIRAMKDSMPEGYSTILEATMIHPLKERLASLNEQITMVQAAMEKHEEASI